MLCVVIFRNPRIYINYNTHEENKIMHVINHQNKLVFLVRFMVKTHPSSPDIFFFIPLAP